MTVKFAVYAALAVLVVSVPARGNITISNAATQNMSCTSGVCSPTATKANLNTNDLEVLLQSGNAEVTTTRAGVQANDIVVTASVTWSSGGVLTLDAYESIMVKQPVAVDGLAGLVLTTKDGGTIGSLSFGPQGNVAFSNLSSNLTINGVDYTLANSIASLAADIAANASGTFALANNYDARADGTYSRTPIPEFKGVLEGLGNRISRYSIADRTDSLVGLFGTIDSTAQVSDIGVVDANVSGTQENGAIGALTGDGGGTITGSFSSGSVSSSGIYSEVGGLVGLDGGTISDCYSAATVMSDAYGVAGGLVASAVFALIERSHATGLVTTGIESVAGGLLGASGYSQVADSYATGSVTVGGWDKSYAYPPAAGGLIGEIQLAQNSTIAITNSYATGAVVGGFRSRVGGLLGWNFVVDSASELIDYSYSTGSVSGGKVGGLIGLDKSPKGDLDDTYWDTDASGITNLSQGAGNRTNDPGITGLSTAQFQSGLPTGFASKIWAESPKINNGLPYLTDNPPPK